jgi:hypothetical protein
MAKKKQIEKNEFFVRCPVYTQSLESCPSSSLILLDEDVANLKEKCLSDEYTSCRIYQATKEKKSQAA